MVKQVPKLNFSRQIHHYFPAPLTVINWGGWPWVQRQRWWESWGEYWWGWCSVTGWGRGCWLHAWLGPLLTATTATPPPPITHQTHTHASLQHPLTSNRWKAAWISLDSGRIRWQFYVRGRPSQLTCWSVGVSGFVSPPGAVWGPMLSGNTCWQFHHIPLHGAEPLFTLLATRAR